MTAVIEKGSRVRVEFEGTYDTDLNNGEKAFTVGESPTYYYAPKDAKVTVVEPPSLPEPPAGSIVKDGFGCCIFKRFSSGWYRLVDDGSSCGSGVSKKARTWPEVVNELGGPDYVRYLVDDPTRTPGVINLKERHLSLTNAKSGMLVEVKWDKMLGGRVRFFGADGHEAFRFTPDAARVLARTIQKTLSN